MQKKYYVKGMVCERCVAAVKETFEGLGIEVAAAGLGEIVLISDDGTKESLIGERLDALGFSLLRDKGLKLSEDTKALIAEVYSGSFDFPGKFRFSTFAAGRLSSGYDNISSTFVATEHTTLEKYIIDFRINKVKELLINTDKTLSDIAFDLGFSSVAHLSGQFKNHTGLNPSYFRRTL